MVEFQWTEGLYPPNWITRRGVLGNQPYVTEDPLPILDKIGTEVVFFQTKSSNKARNSRNFHFCITLMMLLILFKDY